MGRPPSSGSLYGRHGNVPTGTALLCSSCKRPSWENPGLRMDAHCTDSEKASTDNMVKHPSHAQPFDILSPIVTLPQCTLQCTEQVLIASSMTTARSIIIGELRFFFARRGLNGCLGRLGHACRVLLGQGNHLHNPDLVGTKGIMVL